MFVYSPQREMGQTEWGMGLGWVMGHGDGYGRQGELGTQMEKGQNACVLAEAIELDCSA